MLHAQAEVQSKIQDQKLEAIIVEADMAEIIAAHKEQASTVRKGPQWLAALSGSVRPVVTYLIIIEFLAINWAIAWMVIAEEGWPEQAYFARISEASGDGAGAV